MKRLLVCLIVIMLLEESKCVTVQYNNLTLATDISASSMSTITNGLLFVGNVGSVKLYDINGTPKEIKSVALGTAGAIYQSVSCFLDSTICLASEGMNIHQFQVSPSTMTENMTVSLGTDASKDSRILVAAISGSNYFIGAAVYESGSKNVFSKFATNSTLILKSRELTEIQKGTYNSFYELKHLVKTKLISLVVTAPNPGIWFFDVSTLNLVGSWNNYFGKQAYFDFEPAKTRLAVGGTKDIQVIDYSEGKMLLSYIIERATIGIEAFHESTIFIHASTFGVTVFDINTPIVSKYRFGVDLEISSFGVSLEGVVVTIGVGSIKKFWIVPTDQEMTAYCHQSCNKCSIAFTNYRCTACSTIATKSSTTSQCILNDISSVPPGGVHYKISYPISSISTQVTSKSASTSSNKDWVYWLLGGIAVFVVVLVIASGAILLLSKGKKSKADKKHSKKETKKAIELQNNSSHDVSRDNNISFTPESHNLSAYEDQSMHVVEYDVQEKPYGIPQSFYQDEYQDSEH